MGPYIPMHTEDRNCTTGILLINGIAYAIGYPIAVGTVAFCFAFGYTVTFSLARSSESYVWSSERNHKRSTNEQRTT